ncbi:MAG: sugar phosphate isomerase/epimerase [Opitutaceae bacterium]|nr:sugar phosphate isomerase/epimerase [Opitutaceae bacterium]
MKEPLHHYVRPGIVHFMAYPVIKGEGPIIESLTELLSDRFFEVIEISWIKDPEVRKEAKALLEAAGVTVKYGAQPRLLTQGLDLNSLDSATRDRAVAEMIAGIDEASEMGITDFGLLSGPYPGAADEAAAMDVLTTSLNEICTPATNLGVNVALEVFDRSIDKKCLIGPADSAREIAERVKAEHPTFGLMVDLSHIPLLSESSAEALQPVKDHLVHIHIGNAYMDDRSDPAYGDMHPRFGYPGGANDVPEIVAFLDELFKVGYLKIDGSSRSAVSFEIKPVGSENPRTMIANSQRKLVEAWSQVTV